MVNLEKLYTKSRTFKKLTGIAPNKFKKLIIKLDPLFKAAEFKRKNHANRKRMIGGGPQLKLSLEESIFMFLLYTHNHTNYSFVGNLMGIDNSNVGRYFKKIIPPLQEILEIPEEKTNLTKTRIVELIVDATYKQ